VWKGQKEEALEKLMELYTHFLSEGKQGMHWSRSGADALCALRTLWLNEGWEDYWGQQRKFELLKALKGGFGEWEALGYPIETKTAVCSAGKRITSWGRLKSDSF
jgi:hypothetical protein